MNEQQPAGSPAGAPQPASAAQPIVIRQETVAVRRRNWPARFLLMALMFSILMNFAMVSQYGEYFTVSDTPMERYHSGAKDIGVDKIAVIEVSGTIMPPFTKRILQSIEQAKTDAKVRGVVLAVDSPGGLVADSHQIYHHLLELSGDKPVFVAMKRMAASGGYYIAMGAGPEGKIYAEPTTWTGSIGVIIPRYNARLLSEKMGVTSEPLKTGEFKDALSPFRDLSESEEQVWREILNDAFTRFQNVIVENRTKLDGEAVRKLATGQIFTTDQALKNGMIDEIGYEKDAIEGLKQLLKLDDVRVVTYRYQPQLLELLTGSVRANPPKSQWQNLLEMSVPRAMYYCSWGLGVTGW